METINRTAVVITFKEKFVQWINQLPDRSDLIFTLEMLNDDKPVHLIPSHEDDDRDRAWFNKHKLEILEECFESICTEPDWWPEIKSPKIFDEYLSADFHSMVWDMADDEPLERNDYG